MPGDNSEADSAPDPSSLFLLGDERAGIRVHRKPGETIQGKEVPANSLEIVAEGEIHLEQSPTPPIPPNYLDRKAEFRSLPRHEQEEKWDEYIEREKQVLGHEDDSEDSLGNADDDEGRNRDGDGDGTSLLERLARLIPGGG